MLICEIVPDATALLTLEPEELAGVLLEHLNTLVPGDQNLNWHNFFHSPTATFQGYDPQFHQKLQHVFAEAWAWLVREALLIPDPMRGREWFVISRRGAQMRARNDVANYQRINLLPRAQLHASIAQPVSATFMRGEYETAVFQAFKQVEVAVRAAAGLLTTDIGVPLMRKAFDKHSGALSDMAQVEAEREAMAHLFAGAIGHCKNPTSHRSVTLDATSAAELIVFASHLLRIVDARAKANATTAAEFTRHLLEFVAEYMAADEPTRHIAFNGRVIHEAPIFDGDGIPRIYLTCYETDAKKLLLTLSNCEDDDKCIYYYKMHDSLGQLANDDQLRTDVPNSDRVRFLEALRIASSQEWAERVE